MILDKFVKIKLSNGNINFYKKYFPKNNIGDYVELSVQKLSIGSNLKVNVKCEICGNEKKLSYKNYIKNKSNQNIYSQLKSYILHHLI